MSTMCAALQWLVYIPQWILSQRQDQAITALMQLNEGALRSLGPCLESTGQLLRDSTPVALHEATVALRTAQDAVLHEARACGDRLGCESKGEPCGGTLMADLVQRVRCVLGYGCGSTTHGCWVQAGLCKHSGGRGRHQWPW